VSDSAPLPLLIEGEMTIYRAAELKQALLASLDRQAVVEIDLSKVTELDTAGVQLLLLAKQTAQGKNQELHLRHHSPAVLEVFELLNLSAYFGAPVTSE
jgi:anti-sigma B factor antagonist